MKGRARSTRTHGLGMSLGLLGRVATQGFLLLSFARLGGPEAAGRFAVSLAATTPIFMLSGLALKDLLLTHIKPPGLGLSLGAAMGLFTGAAAISVALELTLNVVGSWTIVSGVAILKALEGTLDVCYSQALRWELTGLVIRFLWGNSLVSLFAIATALLKFGPNGALYSSAAISLFFLIALISRLNRPTSQELGVREPSTGDSFAHLLMPGLRLAAAQTLSAASVYVPIYYLNFAGTTEDAGLFASAYYTVTVSNIVFVGLQQVAMSRMARARSLSLRSLRTEQRRFAVEVLAVGSLLSVVVLTTLPTVLPIVFGSEFSVGYNQSALFGLAILILAGLTWALAIQLVRNRYGDQIVQVTVALAISTTLILTMNDRANLNTAILLVITAFSVRIGVALIQIHRSPDSYPDKIQSVEL